MHTRSQKLAQAAFASVKAQLKTNTEGKISLDVKYKSFARTFPSLIHTCGLAQAIAFAEAKEEYHLFLEDLAKVLTASNRTDTGTRSLLASAARTVELSGYMRLSRDAIQAASWLLVRRALPPPEISKSPFRRPPTMAPVM